MVAPKTSVAASRPVVAIVGGGFTGAALAFHLLRLLPEGAARIVLYEPRGVLGGGLAYDTDEPVHRINVPAARMTLVPGDDEHFQRWLLETDALKDDAPATTADGHIFARRADFGRYVAAQLQPLLDDGAVEHRRSLVRAIEKTGTGWRIEAEGAAALQADIVVLAATHPSPLAPAALTRALAAHPRYVPDATVPAALSGIRPEDRVLVVGAGLTAADVIAALEAAGHTGPITAISRRGLRSRGHNLLAQDPFGEFVSPPAHSARDLLRRVRQALAEAGDSGVTWHAVFDRLRGQGRDIWQALPVVEQRRLVRFLRSHWDVHRFRIAPQVEAAIERGLADGRVTFHAASIADVQRGADDTIDVRFRLRHGRGVLDGRYDAVVVTTGPGHGGILSSQPFLAGLGKAGVLQADGVGLGLAVDRQSHAIGAEGAAVETFYIAGPLARGTFGELMGLPQVTEHAVFVAENVARDISARKFEEGTAEILAALSLATA
jgi:uncharacterized NAD(P)/FAD-binding protein YdhS